VESGGCFDPDLLHIERRFGVPEDRRAELKYLEHIACLLDHKVGVGETPLQYALAVELRDQIPTKACILPLDIDPHRALGVSISTEDEFITRPNDGIIQEDTSTARYSTARARLAVGWIRYFDRECDFKRLSQAGLDPLILGHNGPSREGGTHRRGG